MADSAAQDDDADVLAGHLDLGGLLEADDLRGVDHWHADRDLLTVAHELVRLQPSVRGGGPGPIARFLLDLTLGAITASLVGFVFGWTFAAVVSLMLLALCS